MKKVLSKVEILKVLEKISHGKVQMFTHKKTEEDPEDALNIGLEFYILSLKNITPDSINITVHAPEGEHKRRELFDIIYEKLEELEFLKDIKINLELYDKNAEVKSKEIKTIQDLADSLGGGRVFYYGATNENPVTKDYYVLRCNNIDSNSIDLEIISRNASLENKIRERWIKDIKKLEAPGDFVVEI